MSSAVDEKTSAGDLFSSAVNINFTIAIYNNELWIYSADHLPLQRRISITALNISCPRFYSYRARFYIYIDWFIFRRTACSVQINSFLIMKTLINESGTEYLVSSAGE